MGYRVFEERIFEDLINYRSRCERASSQSRGRDIHFTHFVFDMREPPFRSTTEIMFAHTSPSLPWPIDRTSLFLLSARSSSWLDRRPFWSPLLDLPMKIARIRACAWTRTRSTDSFNPLTVGTIISRGNWRWPLERGRRAAVLEALLLKAHFAFVSLYFISIFIPFPSAFFSSSPFFRLILFVIFRLFFNALSTVFCTSGAVNATYVYFL